MTKDQIIACFGRRRFLCFIRSASAANHRVKEFNMMFISTLAFDHEMDNLHFCARSKERNFSVVVADACLFHFRMLFFDWQSRRKSQSVFILWMMTQIEHLLASVNKGTRKRMSFMSACWSRLFSSMSILLWLQIRKMWCVTSVTCSKRRRKCSEHFAR